MNARRLETPEAPPAGLRGDDRGAWDKVIAWLKDEGQHGDPAPVARQALAEYRRFDAAVAKEESELLANPLLWNDEEQALGLWIGRAFHDFTQAAVAALARFAESRLAGQSGNEVASALAALAFTAGGSAVKWAEVAGAGRRGTAVAEMNRAYGIVESLGLARETPSVVAAGRELAPSLEAHYARVMLLDAFCRGNLGRAQVAILDCWLWAWAGEYKVTRTPMPGALLAVEGHGSRGARALAAGETPTGRLLWIEPLAAQIAAAIRAFHEGVIPPGRGIALIFRVEEHAAVLDHLRAFLEIARRGLPARQAREGCEAFVELLVGLPEILAKAFSTRAWAGNVVAPSAGHRSIEERQLEVTRRRFRLVDESASGLGLEGEDPDQNLVVGTLAALRREDGGPPLLVEVARRVAVAGAPTRIGMRILSGDPRRLPLERHSRRGHVDALYLPGTDSSGRADAILVAQSDFDPQAYLDASLGDRRYSLRLNRIRHLGRGWVLAGIEVAEERAHDVPPTRELTLAPA